MEKLDRTNEFVFEFHLEKKVDNKTITTQKISKKVHSLKAFIEQKRSLKDFIEIKANAGENVLSHFHQVIPMGKKVLQQWGYIESHKINDDINDDIIRTNEVIIREEIKNKKILTENWINMELAFEGKEVTHD